MEIHKQRCKDWLLKNAISSALRTMAIGKYLVALSASYAASGKDAQSRGLGPFEQSPARRKQLHILYLLNDLLHHAKYHTDSLVTYSTLTSNLQPHLIDLFGHASAYDSSKYARQHKKLNELLDIWDQKNFYQSEYIDKLRETTTNAARLGYSGGDDGSRHQNGMSEDLVAGIKKNAPFIMPAAHGDNTTPYYDLPAGNMMPHIVPNSSTPINPQLVKPLQFVAGPADEMLATAVKGFMNDVELLYGMGADEVDNVVIDIDELGQPAIRDEITGDLMDGESYYGWSRAFCEKMKRRRNGKESAEQDLRRSRSVARSLTPRKRRRYSDSESSRSRSRTSLQSRSRSRGRNEPMRRKDQRRSYSSSRSSSRSRQRFQSGGGRSDSRRRTTSGRRSRTRSYSPDREQPASTDNPQPPFIQQTQGPSLSPLPFPNSLNGVSLGPNGLPIPPPPPPNYKGSWPPPPPPPPMQAQTGQFPPFSALVPPPPPPYPPPPANPHPANMYQGEFLAPGQQTQFPNTVGAWSQQQGNSSSRGQYGGRGGSQFGRSYRGGFN